MPHEPFIRTLIAMHKQNYIAQDELIAELDFHFKQIRNDDLKKHGFANKRQFDEQDRALYDSCLPQYKQAAKDRLAAFIDHERRLNIPCKRKPICGSFLRWIAIMQTCLRAYWITAPSPSFTIKNI
jgi:hypothetical protein